MKTRVTELLGIEYPIIQGGMAWVATHELASAVSNAGGLGIIGAGGAPASWVREQIQAAKKETDKPFGVNLMLMNPEADEIAKVIVEEGVKVVTTGAGNPAKYMSNGVRWSHRCPDDDDTRTTGSRCGIHSGHCSRWNCRWTWICGSYDAWRRGSTDGNPFCCCKRIHGS